MKNIIDGMIWSATIPIVMWIVSVYSHAMWRWGWLDFTWIGKAIGTVTCGG